MDNQKIIATGIGLGLILSGCRPGESQPTGSIPSPTAEIANRTTVYPDVCTPIINKICGNVADSTLDLPQSENIVDQDYVVSLHCAYQTGEISFEVFAAKIGRIQIIDPYFIPDKFQPQNNKNVDNIISIDPNNYTYRSVENAKDGKFIVNYCEYVDGELSNQYTRVLPKDTRLTANSNTIYSPDKLKFRPQKRVRDNKRLKAAVSPRRSLEQKIESSTADYREFYQNPNPGTYKKALLRLIIDWGWDSDITSGVNNEMARILGISELGVSTSDELISNLMDEIYATVFKTKASRYGDRNTHKHINAGTLSRAAKAQYLRSLKRFW